MQNVQQWTIQVAFNDTNRRALMIVEGPEMREAIREAIRRVDSGEVDTQEASFDPGPTYVEAIRVGAHITAWSNDQVAIPEEYTEGYTYLNQVQKAAPDLLTHLQSVLEKLGQQGVLEQYDAGGVATALVASLTDDTSEAGQPAGGAAPPSGEGA